jgi:hypothetical protein
VLEVVAVARAAVDKTAVARRLLQVAVWAFGDRVQMADQSLNHSPTLN